MSLTYFDQISIFRCGVFVFYFFRGCSTFLLLKSFFEVWHYVSATIVRVNLYLCSRPYILHSKHCWEKSTFKFQLTIFYLFPQLLLPRFYTLGIDQYHWSSGLFIPILLFHYYIYFLATKSAGTSVLFVVLWAISLFVFFTRRTLRIFDSYL